MLLAVFVPKMPPQMVFEWCLDGQHERSQNGVSMPIRKLYIRKWPANMVPEWCLGGHLGFGPPTLVANNGPRIAPELCLGATQNLVSAKMPAQMVPEWCLDGVWMTHRLLAGGNTSCKTAAVSQPSSLRPSADLETLVCVLLKSRVRVRRAQGGQAL